MTRSNTTPELWPGTGFQYLSVLDNGFLGVTEGFLRNCFLRPELEPVEESCPAELALRNVLIDDPSRNVSLQDLEALADPDAVENFNVMLSFRDRLLAAETIEGCYLASFSDDQPPIPFVFLNLMVCLITQNVLKGIQDPFVLRAAELLFRKQAINIHEGAILSIDHLTALELENKHSNLGTLGRTLVEGGVIPNPNELDVMTEDNAAQYAERSHAFDYVLDLTFSRRGLDALCKVMELWIGHLLMVDVKITPLQEVVDDQWVWHTGLDVESTSLLNDLYQNNEISEQRMTQLLSLFKAEFTDSAVLETRAVGHPVYMGLCMDQTKRLQMKPQNLLFNMPLISALN